MKYITIFLVALCLMVSGTVATVSTVPLTNESVSTISTTISTSILLYSKAITDFRVLANLGNGIYLVEVNVNTSVENVIRPGKYMQIKIPHLVKLNVEEIRRLNDRR